MGDELNLDAIQAAEAEDAGEGLTFDFAGHKFTTPGVLPVEYLFTVTRLGIKEAIDMLLGDDAAKFWAAKPGRKVLEALDQAIAKHYGFGNAGNSEASAGSSRNGTGRSRPTSSATTA